MLSKLAMDRPVMALPASSVPTTGVKVEPTQAGLQTPLALRLNMEVQRGPHTARPVATKILPLEGTGKRPVTTTIPPAPPEQSLQSLVR